MEGKRVGSSDESLSPDRAGGGKLFSGLGFGLWVRAHAQSCVGGGPYPGGRDGSYDEAALARELAMPMDKSFLLSFSLGYPREGPFVWVALGLLTNHSYQLFFFKKKLLLYMPICKVVLCLYNIIFLSFL
jgi:hypothetical protein